MTIQTVLIVAALLLTAVHAANDAKPPLWLPVLLLCIALLAPLLQ